MSGVVVAVARQGRPDVLCGNRFFRQALYAGILAMSLLGLVLYFVIYNLELKVNRYRTEEPN